ncbi:hypothetical protein HDU81_010196 [Chytriomyces hyalinus]|nr:hypothetical protein HDU81_010196 [Chytriomyces hyalinus]
MLDHLPFEVVVQVLALLDPFRVFTLQRTSRRVFAVLGSTLFAQKLLQNQKWTEENIDTRATIRRKRQPERFSILPSRQCPDQLDCLWLYAPPGFQQVYALKRLYNVLRFNAHQPFSLPPLYMIGVSARRRTIPMIHLRIPSAFGLLTQMTELHIVSKPSTMIRRHQFAGPIPVEIGNMRSLLILEIDGQMISCASLEFLGNLTHLVQLDLHSPLIECVIPPSVGNLVFLDILDLSNCSLHGPLPHEIFALKFLKTLNLANNKLSGPIPVQISKLTRIYSIHLENNCLSGAIPNELGSLFQLEDLRLSNNQLTGVIPPELGDLVHLQTLYLNGNKLSGSIPRRLFPQRCRLVDLNLSNNRLTGLIPSEIGNCTNLVWLFLSGANLYGRIPYTLARCVSLKNLDLKQNQLNGPIPEELCSLSSLRYFNLEDNYLLGVVPFGLAECVQKRGVFHVLKGNWLQAADLVPDDFGEFYMHMIQGERS